MLDLVVFWIQFTITALIVLMLWFNYLGPYFKKRDVQEGLTALTVPLLFQHIAMTTLVDSVVHPTMAPQFGWVVSICNIVTIPIALLALSALRRRASSALAFTWLLSVVGVLAGIATGTAAALYNVIPSFGPHWYVGILYIPMQGLCHVLTIMLLVQRGRELQAKVEGLPAPALA